VADELNPGIAILNALTWPALLAASHHSASRLIWLKCAALFMLVAAATFLSEHDASKVALLCATCIFALSLMRPKWAIRTVAIGFIGACLAIVPVVQAAYREGWHLSSAIPENGRARLIIWDATADKVKLHPLLGVGANSTKFLSGQSAGEQRAGHIIPWATGNHAHNVFLQAWYELGAAGVALLLALALAVLAAVGRMPRDTMPYALAAFTSATAINSLSWSIWYPWVLASLFLAAFMVLLGQKAAQTPVRKQNSP
jgi:O-antigen ligase